jgi:hypothetical protein
MTDLFDSFGNRTENQGLMLVVTSPEQYRGVRYWYDSNAPFCRNLDFLLNHLNIPAGDLNARLQEWGSRDFDTDYQDRDYVANLSALRGILGTAGGLILAGLVTPDNTPENSPDRRGGGGNADGVADIVHWTIFKSIG